MMLVFSGKKKTVLCDIRKQCGKAALFQLSLYGWILGCGCISYVTNDKKWSFLPLCNFFPFCSATVVSLSIF